MMFRWTLLVFILTLTLTGCRPLQTGAGALPSEPVVPPQGDVIEMTSTPIAPGLERLVNMAKEDLVQRLTIPMDEIELVEARAVVWPDSSLGCPQPGMSYLQVLQEGALIIVRARENDYEYHAGGDRGLFLCEKMGKDPTRPSSIDILRLTPSSSNPDPSKPDSGQPPDEYQ
jgi:hypothetical protein